MIWHLCFARVRKVYSHILVKVCAVAMATGQVKNKALKMVFVDLKKPIKWVFLNQQILLDFFIVCPLRIYMKSLLSTLFS